MKVSLVSTGAEPVRRFIEHLKLAELLGFHGLFHADRKWTREAFSRLGAATQCTTRLMLGIHMVDPGTRHPALVAQAAATLAEMAPGRLRVIMASGGDFSTLPGYGNPSPQAALREAFDLTQRLWRGERVTLDGEVLKFNNGSLDWRPSDIPQLHIASRDPQILKLAGGVAGGIVIDGLASAIGLDYAKRHILSGLHEAGRDWKDVWLSCSIPVCILEREDEPIPEEITRVTGPAFAGNQKELADLVNKAARGGAQSRGIVDSFALVGTGPQVLERVKALAAAGVQEIVVTPVFTQGQDMEDFMFRLAKDVLPYFAAQTLRAS